MTLHDVRRFSKYAEKHIPLRVLVAACAAMLGAKIPEAEEKKPPPKYLTAEEFKRIVQATGGRVPGVGMM